MTGADRLAPAAERARQVGWHRAEDGRRFRVYERRCVHTACFAARCECGHLLTAHDFDASGAVASALDCLRRPAAPPDFGHPTCEPHD